MKQALRKTLLILTVLLVPLLTSCTNISDLIVDQSSTSSSQETTSDSTSDELQLLSLNDLLSGLDYSLSVTELEAYLANIDSTSPVIATALVMPNVVEVTVDVEYSYTTSYRTPGGTQTQTITDEFSSLATAFFINEDGYLVTNAHVVSLDDYEDYPGFEVLSETVYFNFADSDEYFTATIIDYDNDLDLAILKSDTTFTDQTYLTFFNISSDNELYYGEEVIAVGNANGDGISVTDGVISAPLRYFEDGYNTIEAIQTDAAINEGNSGGPLTNLYGAVVGINSFKIITSTSESLGYAIPSNIVMEYLNDLGITYYTTNDRTY